MLSDLARPIHAEQQARLAADLELRSQVIESNQGTRYGWVVLLEGQPVCALSDPKYADMFWISYAIEPVGKDAEENAKLAGREFWLRDDLEFRNRELDLIAPFAFAAGAGPKQGRIEMRGLYIVVPKVPVGPSLWEWLAGCFSSVRRLVWR
jgi:hypothetical protein